MIPAPAPVQPAPPAPALPAPPAPENNAGSVASVGSVFPGFGGLENAPAQGPLMPTGAGAVRTNTGNTEMEGGKRHKKYRKTHCKNNKKPLSRHGRNKQKCRSRSRRSRSRRSRSRGRNA